MECEVCGRVIEKPISVNIEGTVMRTCYACSKFGTRVVMRKKRARVKTKKPYRGVKEKALETLPGYGDLLRREREKLGLTQEELGKRLNEKTSVIARLEAEKMSPSESLAKKLEKHMGIKILAEIEEPELKGSRASDRELTLGDIVKIKKKI